jgi:hypothetical protein
MYGVVAPGLGRQPSRWIDERGIPVSLWGFSVGDTTLPSNEQNQIIEKRTFRVPDGTITCVRYWPNWWGAQDRRYSRIDCSGPRGFSAFMEGEAQDVPTFFSVLARIS